MLITTNAALISNNPKRRIGALHTTYLEYSRPFQSLDPGDNKGRSKGLTEMGACSSKDGNDNCEGVDVGELKEKIRLLREEVRGVMFEMDKETKSHKKEMVVFSLKEGGWKTEKKKLKEEVKILRNKVKMEGSPNTIFEQIQQERAGRDDAIHKWKQLYHAIKIELDHLIQTTHNGEGLQWGANESTEALQRELQAKEETIKALKEQVVSMEQEKYKRDIEIDILRQSLRIVISRKEPKIETLHKWDCKKQKNTIRMMNK